MKMTDEAFDEYFMETFWQGTQSVPAESRLKELEQKFIDVLTRQKRVGMKDGSFAYLFSVNGKKLISRIGYCKRLKEEDEKVNDGVNKLLASYERVRLAMKYLDRHLYEKEMRKEITKGKSAIKPKQCNQDEQNTPSKPMQDEKRDTPNPVISGVQGLADYLGCGKSMAFSIIKDGVLKKEGIQYMVGKCWKFNRQKLDEHLKMHPEMLSRIRCKR